jgi:hypothetical protein
MLPQKLLIGLEGAHAFYVSIFDGFEHLQTTVRGGDEERLSMRAGIAEWFGS